MDKGADETEREGLSRRALLTAGLGWLGAWWVQGAAAGQAAPAKKKRFVCLAGTLLDEAIGNLFIDEGEKVFGQWEALGTPEKRIAALWGAVNAALARAGTPMLKRPVVGVLEKPLGAVFVPGAWRHTVDPEKFKPAHLSREEGIALLAFTYHEARHVEQFWLMARWRVLKGTKTVRALREVGVAEKVAELALGCPLPRHSLLEPLIAAWFQNYQTDMVREHNRLIDAFRQGESPKQAEAPDAGGQRTAAEELALERYHRQALQEDAERAGEWIIMLIRKREPGR